MSYRETYTNGNGEVLGYGTVYDDGPDPDEFYEAMMQEPDDEYGDYYDEPAEPVRCELDIPWEGYSTVCLSPLRADGTCPNDDIHLTEGN